MRGYLIFLFDGLAQSIGREDALIIRADLHYLFDAEIAIIIEAIIFIFSQVAPRQPFVPLDRAFHQLVMAVFATPWQDGVFALGHPFVDLFESDHEIVYQTVFIGRFYFVVKLSRVKFGRAMDDGSQDMLSLLGRLFI